MATSGWVRTRPGDRQSHRIVVDLRHRQLFARLVLSHDGWYWAVALLQSEGASVHLVNPSGLAWENRRVKNDYRDCKDLLERLRLHKLPEAWIAPPEVRELRELVRYRARLVASRTGSRPSSRRCWPSRACTPR